ncbi:hypothetical protein YH65_04775 [Sulfurovum lithotrophicum]|uniref:Uncharacterized protein n=1 Tax=Sulfurovum lithotrophicum TaxID=206403 RepID=A0A7U4M0W1_9BACT|nr:hypothetical protein [Sulfurovum lithotrophicum]AKF24774.1 hypothetical protein YH65_04775 [Sulfurovum lithotrophicum]
MKKYLLAALMLSVTLFADIKVGDAFPKMTLQDQFGKAHMLSRHDRLILMAFEKDVSIGLSDYLKSKGNTFLSQHHAIFHHFHVCTAQNEEVSFSCIADS